MKGWLLFLVFICMLLLWWARERRINRRWLLRFRYPYMKFAHGLFSFSLFCHPPYLSFSPFILLKYEHKICGSRQGLPSASTSHQHEKLGTYTRTDEVKGSMRSNIWSNSEDLAHMAEEYMVYLGIVICFSSELKVEHREVHHPNNISLCVNQMVVEIFSLWEEQPHLKLFWSLVGAGRGASKKKFQVLTGLHKYKIT